MLETPNRAPDLTIIPWDFWFKELLCKANKESLVAFPLLSPDIFQLYLIVDEHSGMQELCFMVHSEKCLRWPKRFQDAYLDYLVESSILGLNSETI